MTSIEAMEHDTLSIPNLSSYPCEALDYPVNALGPVSGLAQSLAEALQVPLALVAQNILSALSLATQGIADVQTPFIARSPLSLCLITTVESQPRKRLLQSILFSELILYQKDQIKFDAYRARKADPAALNKKRNDAHKSVLGCIFFPQEQHLSKIIADIQYYPATIMFKSDDIIQFIGKIGQRNTSAQSTASQHLDDLWSGEDIVQITKSNTEIVSNQRCTFSLHTSKAQAVELLNADKPTAHALLSKALIAAPENIIGKRLIKEIKSDEVDGLNDFHNRCIDLLLKTTPYSEKATEEFSLRLLKLKDNERQILLEFVREIETHSGPEGFFSKIAAFSENAAEHVCRLAGVLQLYADPEAESISKAVLHDAMSLFAFYAVEAFRVRELKTNAHAQSEDLILLSWMLDKSKELQISTGSESLPLRYVQQRTKTQFRKVEKLLELISLLETKQYVNYDKDRKLISLRVSEVPVEM